MTKELEIVKYKKRFYYVVSKNEEIFYNNLPTSEMIEAIIKHKGAFLVCSMKGKMKKEIIYADDKNLESIPKNSKIYKNVIEKAKRIL